MVGSDKQTICRLEQGGHTKAREHTIQQLARALNADPAVLTGETPLSDTEDDSRYFLMSKLNFRITTRAYNALYLVSQRYDVTHQEIVELAPFLFCCAAEASLRQRRDRVRQAELACENARRLEREMRHLPAPNFTYSEEKIAAENDSINSQDLFGLLLDDVAFGLSTSNRWTENPFAIFLDGLANETEGTATFEAYAFRDVPEYRVCPEEAAQIVNGDSELAEEILEGHIALNEMPKEIRKIGMAKEQAEWVRVKVDEFRNEILRRL